MLYWKAKPCRTKTIINYVITPETAEYMGRMVEIAAETQADALTFQHEAFLTRKDVLRHDRAWAAAFTGDVIVCQAIPKVVGSVRREGLFEIINNEPFVSFRQSIRKAGGLFPACARCCKLYRTF